MALSERSKMLLANAQKAYPRYLLSSMVDDCITRGRSLHEGGVCYADYGLLPIGLPDAAAKPSPFRKRGKVSPKVTDEGLHETRPKPPCLKGGRQADGLSGGI